MSISDRLKRLGTLARRLPFAVDDYEAASQAFVRWRESGRDADLETIEVWLYCYSQRYVLTRLMREAPLAAGETDRILGDVFSRARDKLDSVAEPERFSHWASVVCRNAFLNSVRRLFQRTDLDDAPVATYDADEETMATLDRSLVRHVVDRAVARLPAALEPIARLRLIEQHSYDHIAAATAHPLPTVRTYAAKAVGRLREDPELRALLHDLDLADKVHAPVPLP